MIAFMTFKDFQSSLVPLIEGLCSSDSSFRVYVHIFCSSFSEENMFQKKSSSRFHPASQHIYTLVYFVHIYEHRYAEIQFIWILRALQVSRRDPWAHIRVPHVQSRQCVTVCVRIHTHTPTYTPTHVKK